MTFRCTSTLGVRDALIVSARGALIVSILAALILDLLSVGLLSAQDVEDVEPVNHLPNPYETVRDWGELPDGREWGSVPAIQIDPDGRSLWMLDSRAASPEELERFPEAAGMGHQVFKLSPEGEVLLTLGTPGEAGDPPDRLDQPLDVAVAPDGDVFVAEGDHGGSDVARISRFSPDGTFETSWGRPGSAPGELRIPHGLAFDAEGRLYVADRGNHRVQIFDQDGDFVDEYRQFGRPSDVFIDEEGLLYAIDSESGQRLNPGWRKGVRIGRAADGEVLYFIPPHFIWDEHLFPSGITVYSEGAAGDGVTVDADGNVYAAEVGTGNPIVGITQYIRRFELED